MFFIFALSALICLISNISCMQQQNNQGQQQQQNPPQPFHLSPHLQQQYQQDHANEKIVMQKVNGKKFAFGSNS